MLLQDPREKMAVVCTGLVAINISKKLVLRYILKEILKLEDKKLN